MVNQPQEEAIDVTPELDGGVLKTILKEGEGVSKPSNGCKVSVHYVGTLTDGTVFDSSRERSEPFEFELGKDHVIKAWDIGIATMRKGEIAKLTCQPQYAYGAAGSPPKIPPNATLIFEVEMISWKAEDLSPKRDGGILRTIIESGEGFSSPNDGATVDIHLTGECNGQVFEDRDVIFCIGEGSEHNICDGVERALEKFKIKEKSKLQIKSRYAFGSAGKPELNIPPNADLEYTITLNNFEKLKDFWTLDAPEKLAQASFFKEKGSRYFKDGKYELACKLYDKMNSYINSTAGFSEAEEVSVKDLQKAMHLNLALCYLKLNRNLDARNECNSVLEVDPNNEKALFRRGQSYMNLAEPEPAIKDFETVLKLDPKNSAATRGIQQCKDLLKKQRSQEKKIYANMFEKFAKHDKESWVYGWWDGKGVQTDKYIPPESEEEALLQRKKEREALLKELERKKLHMQQEKQRLEAEKLENSETLQDSLDSTPSIEDSPQSSDIPVEASCSEQSTPSVADNPQNSVVNPDVPVEGSSSDQSL